METNRLTVLQGVWKKDLHDTPKGSQSSFFLLTVRLERRKQKQVLLQLSYISALASLSAAHFCHDRGNAHTPCLQVGETKSEALSSRVVLGLLDVEAVEEKS